MRSVEALADQLTQARRTLAQHAAQAQVEIESQAYLRGVSDALLWALQLDEESLEAESMAASTTRGTSALVDELPDDLAGEAEVRLRLAEGSRDRSTTLIRSVRALPFGQMGAADGYVLIACPDAPGIYPQPAWARLVPSGMARRLAHAILESVTSTNRA